MDADAHLLMISDPHLFADPHGMLRGVRTLESLEHALEHAAARLDAVDAIVCCGDIVNDEPDGYAHFVRVLGAFGKPVYCVPGNHDDPRRLHAALARAPFQVGGHVDLGPWRLVLLDSCVAGRAGGRIGAPQLELLRRSLDSAPQHALVCLHHQPVGMASRWLDGIGIENANEFLDVLDAHRQVRAVAWGHVHQCFDSRRRGVRLLATPSTNVQFRPLSNEFALDRKPPAYRRLALRGDGTIQTEVVWVEQALAGAVAATA